jgi:ABC-type Fe3+/spermidine/putrescine transport system ATPase subunit
LEIEVRGYQVELGIPFIYVTHNQEEALAMSDRVAVLHEGRIEQVGPKIEVYNRPVTRFVASFVGSPNRLAGTIVETHGGEMRVDWHGLTVVARRPDGAKQGDEVELFLKSEHISIAVADAGGGFDNCIEGTVRDIIFKGQIADYLIQLPNEAELVVSGPPELPDVARGSRVAVHWAAEAAIAFVVESEAA